MAQTLPRFCPRCGAPLEGHRICANCGLRLEDQAPHQAQNTPTSPPSQNYQEWGYDQGPSPISQHPSQPGFPDQPQQMGPGYSGRPSQPGFPDQPQQMGPGYGYSQEASQPAYGPGDQPPGWPPAAGPGGYVPPRDRSAPPQKRLNARTGCIAIALILLLLVLGGTVVASVLGIIPGLKSNQNITQTPIKTFQINRSLPYAGIDLTVMNAQQSGDFVNDPNTATDGMLRLNIQEQNNLKETVNWLYSDTAHLVLPNGKVISPTFAKARGGVGPGAVQMSYVDFAVPASTKLDQLTLRMGSNNQAQMDLPLAGQIDQTKYQPKNSKLSGVVTAYLQQGLVYTATDVTTSLYLPGRQADKGMQFLSLDFSVENTLAQTAIPGPAFDYMRLKTTSSLNQPVTTTLPISFAVGQKGATGNVVFQAPQNETNFTIVFLAQPQEGIDQTKVSFQLP